LTSSDKDKSNTLKKLNQSFKTLVFQLSKNEVELSEKIKELRDFAHIIAHDLHSPLATAFSYQSLIIEKIKKGEFDVENDLDYAEVVASKLMSSMQLIDEMLHYAESGGKVDLNKSISVHDVVSLALSNTSDQIQKTQAMVSVHIDHFVIKGSSSLLSSVLTNLLNNSIKYIDDNTTPVIDIIAGLDDEKNKYIQISDNGVGIPNDKLNSIFEEFVRLGQDKKGSGIGLSTVKRILEAHNANIKVSSDVGKGSTFKMLFK
jgi:signal transduction histidine kinase